MLHYKNRGRRVKVKFPTRTAFRYFQGSETGTVLCEVENNLGKRIVEIEWDGIGQSPLFPEEFIYLDEPHD